MELKDFRGTFKSWSDVPDIEDVYRYKKINNSTIPQTGDYIEIIDAKGYPYRTLYSTETLASDDSSIVGRMLAQDVTFISPNISRGTVLTYEDYLRLRGIEANLVFYKGLSWRFILSSSWSAGELDSTKTYFVGDTVKFGSTYMKYNGLKNDPWEIVDYVPGKSQWTPLEEIDESYFSSYALENQVQNNTKNLRKALANKSNIFWGSMNLTDEAIQVIIPNSTYNARNIDNLSCFEGDTLWLNITNTTTGAFGQLYLTALEDCTSDTELVSTKVRSFVWSGVDGAVWFSGEGSPSDSTAPGAKVGDFYLDTLSGEVYALERTDDGEGNIETLWVFKSLIRGKDGDSLDSIVEYYLASDLDTGVTYDTPHWNDKGTNPGDIDYTVISFERPYLWNYEKITRTVDGTPTVTKTPPRIVGTYGGKGISSITDYYILTADENFVPSKTDDDWSNTPPVITPLLKCLWNYTRIEYTDGSHSESEIAAIGRFGDKGNDGLSAFDIAVEHGYVGTEEQWLNTLKGSDGDKWFNSNGVPSDSIGTEGDWCVDTSTGNVYHKVSGHWTSDGNIRGDDGDKWFNGSGAPTSSVPAGAVEGDYYLDTSTGDVYQKKSDGTWGERVGNIKGPAGSKGSDGVSQYIFIMYSPDPSTDTLHTKDERTDEDVWMGIAVVSEEASEETEVPDAPTNPADYEWSKVVGENGSDAAQLNICGEWKPNFDYVNNDSQIDVVYVDDPAYTKGTYACTHTHRSGSIFDPANWTLMTANGTDGTDGTSPVLLTLSNENCSVPSNADGSSPVLTNAKTTAALYVGGDAVTASYRVSNKSESITVSQSGNEFTITDFTSDSGFVDIEATYDEKTYVKRFMISKQKKGADGEDAISYWIDKSVNLIKRNVNSNPVDLIPDYVTFTAMRQVGDGNPSKFSTGILKLYKNGDSLVDVTSVGGVLTYNLETSPTKDTDTHFTVKLYENVDSTTVLDTETVLIVESGKNGTNGIDGISQHIHIKYAPTDDTSINDMSDTLRSTDKYLGMAVTQGTTPPDIKSSYEWSYFVGEDGQPGLPGTPGTPGNNGVSMRSKGEWQANTDYVNNSSYIDIVYYDTDGCSYLCKTSHTSGSTFDSSKWTLVAHKGASGSNGVSEYVHLAYSVDGSTDIHQTLAATDRFMGICVNITQAWSDSYSYAWSKINPSDGINGTNGNSPRARGEWEYDSQDPITYYASDGYIDIVYNDTVGATFICKTTHQSSSDFNYDWQTRHYWEVLAYDGEDGADGHTPVITATKDGKTTTIVADGASIASIIDGNDGISPTVSKSGKIVTITDASGVGVTISDGEDGVGLPGENAYFHIAWANSADGTVDFSTTVASGKQYMGTYTDSTQADSLTPSDYKWVKTKGEVGDSITITTRTIKYKNSQSGITPPIDPQDPTSGWENSPNPIDEQYLWTQVYVKYSDNTEIYSYSVSYIPKDGDPGPTGDTYYTYIKYSDSANGDPMSDDSSKRYMGICTSKNTTAPDNPSLYSWSKIREPLVTSIIEYTVSTSQSSPGSGATWSSNVENWSVGKYIFKRYRYKYDDGSPDTFSTETIYDSTLTEQYLNMVEFSFTPDRATYQVDKRIINGVPTTIRITPNIFGYGNLNISYAVSPTSSSISVNDNVISIAKDTLEASFELTMSATYTLGSTSTPLSYSYVFTAEDVTEYNKNFGVQSSLPSSKCFEGDICCLVTNGTYKPYEYTNEQWVEISTITDSPEAISRIRDTLLASGINVTESSTILYAYIKNLAAQNAVIDAISTKNMELQSGGVIRSTGKEYNDGNDGFYLDSQGKAEFVNILVKDSTLTGTLVSEVLETTVTPEEGQIMSSTLESNKWFLMGSMISHISGDTTNFPHNTMLSNNNIQITNLVDNSTISRNTSAMYVDGVATSMSITPPTFSGAGLEQTFRYPSTNYNRASSFVFFPSRKRLNYTTVPSATYYTYSWETSTGSLTWRKTSYPSNQSQPANTSEGVRYASAAQPTGTKYYTYTQEGTATLYDYTAITHKYEGYWETTSSNTSTTTSTASTKPKPKRTDTRTSTASPGDTAYSIVPGTVTGSSGNWQWEVTSTHYVFRVNTDPGAYPVEEEYTGKTSIPQDDPDPSEYNDGDTYVTEYWQRASYTAYYYKQVTHTATVHTNQGKGTPVSTYSDIYPNCYYQLSSSTTAPSSGWTSYSPGTTLNISIPSNQNLWFKESFTPAADRTEKIYTVSNYEINTTSPATYDDGQSSAGSFSNASIRPNYSVGLNILSSNGSSSLTRFTVNDDTWHNGTFKINNITLATATSISPSSITNGSKWVGLGSASGSSSNIASFNISYNKIYSRSENLNVPSGVNLVEINYNGKNVDGLLSNQTYFAINEKDLFTSLTFEFTPYAKPRGVYLKGNIIPSAGSTWDIGGPSKEIDDIYANRFHGNLIGDVQGNVQGNVDGNVSGSSGSCTGNAATATSATSATRADTAGDGSMLVIGNHSNEVNFGGTSGGSTIYFGYRAEGSKSVPTVYYFGNPSSGLAEINVSKTTGDVNASGTTHKVWGAVFN